MKPVYFSNTRLSCQGIVFDKDGTLIDIFPMLQALAHERYRHLSEKVDPENLRYYGKCTGYSPESGTVEPFGPLASARKRDEVAVAACSLWLSGIPWFKALEIAKEAYDKADETLDPMQGVSLLPGIRQALTDLHKEGLPLFIVTSDGHERAERMLFRLGLKDLFHMIVGADDVKETKPSPEGVFFCAQSIGVDPKDLVIIGDAPQDALMAKNAKSHAVGVLTGVSSHNTLAKYCDLVIEGAWDIRPAK